MEHEIIVSNKLNYKHELELGKFNDQKQNKNKKLLENKSAYN